MIMRVIVLLSVLSTLTACASTNNITVTAKPIEIDIAKTADPAEVRMQPVTFKVVTKDTVDSFIQTMSKTQGTNTPVFIAITTKDYENLSLNLADLRRYIEQQQAVIVYYRNLTTHNQP